MTITRGAVDRRWGRSVVAALVAMGLLSGPLDAQTPVSSRSRLTVKRVVPGASGGNVCAELESSPSPLVHAPEGLALLRLKRQLESAALTLEQRQALERDKLQRIAQVQRGVDSLMQVMVRFTREETPERIERAPAPPPPVTGRRMFVTVDSGDGPVTIDLEAMMRGGALAVRRVPDSSATNGFANSFMVMAPQVNRIIRALQPQVAAFAGEAEAALPSHVAAPSGYMGLSLTGAQLRIVTPEGVMTSHCEYPLVETVDVGSPAARAGLSTGDTLLSYNGRDVTEFAVNYPELITAGNTVRVKVRRAGKAREIPVQVAPRNVERTFIFVPQGVQQGVPPARIMLSPVSPTMSPSRFEPSAVAVLAGAQFVNMDDDFASSLGLENGVLVLRVPSGTPAADAGLRGGDVVRTVNGASVRDVAMLRRALQTARGEARLQVQSRGATRMVVLELR